ncbi:hypothetical protein BDA99DRAFT_593923 [Phascolomyces articulosus]|uniref:Heterokaryon incompatibility domain-containing protein n=1 Tax=Phascolomyces articulosus TaxID=60185 RepID=A0AAD5JY81_9FUNG|nr:hypothetical protein BDA99DRAFT_593923 [Phascolomyces articulosus]
MAHFQCFDNTAFKKYKNPRSFSKKKMYITYETAQYIHTFLDQEKVGFRHFQPPRRVPNDFPKPDFIPTKLVRISDMKVVDGSQLNEGYCALSYSWNQSADILIDETTGKYKRIDEGKHKIISYDSISREIIIPKYQMSLSLELQSNETYIKWKKIYEVLEIMEYNNYYFTKTIQYVKFEGIIQRICQQFNIKYIWYDQMCINQDNKEEKQHEIRNMHHIYENAYCTVALVPDFSLEKYLNAGEQQYFKRLWTLEESIKSERLVFVGGNSSKLKFKAG